MKQPKTSAVTAMPAHSPNPAQTLCKALFRAADALGLRQAELGRAIGLERTSVSRLKNKGVLDPDSKTGELAACVIRIYRDLFALLGADETAIRHWMATPNLHLNGAPNELIQQVQGLVRVIAYLDAMRGKV